jgi:hypothetical protein
MIALSFVDDPRRESVIFMTAHRAATSLKIDVALNFGLERFSSVADSLFIIIALVYITIREPEIIAAF